MTIKVSTGLRNGMLAAGTLRSLLSLGFIKIYNGPVPATADAALAAGNTLLCTISNGGSATGLTMAAAAVNGVLEKNADEPWSGTNVSGGIATFYRHVAPGDTGVDSPTQVRVQGGIGKLGADMNLTETTLSNGAVQTVDFYSLSLPTL